MGSRMWHERWFRDNEITSRDMQRDARRDALHVAATTKALEPKFRPERSQARFSSLQLRGSD